LLPRWYKYPMLTYDLGMLNVGWNAISHLVSGDPHPDGWKVHLVRDIYKLSFLKRLRAEQVILAYLSIFWIFIALYRRRGNPWEGLLGAATFGFSWEIGYHFRWFMGDPLMVMFVCLAIMAVFCAQTSPNPRRWWRLAAIATGLATSAKYPGGALIVPVLLSILLHRDDTTAFRKRVIVGIEAITLMALTFVITTPGAVLDPFMFVKGMLAQQHVYAHGHGGHTIQPGLPHMQQMTIYIGLVGLSRFAVVAGALSVLAIAGTVTLIREDWRLALTYLSYPILLFLFFGTYSVMLVRNLIPFVPVAAILVGIGGFAIYRGLAARQRVARLYIATLVVTVVFNGGWLLFEGNSILTRGTTDYIAQLNRYLASHANRRFVISATVRAALTETGNSAHTNMVSVPGEADAAIFYMDEVTPWQRWPCNNRRFFDTWFGPREVNLNYYPNWAGDNRIVVVPIAHTSGLGLFDEP
jgi:hypothetical protein